MIQVINAREENACASQLIGNNNGLDSKERFQILQLILSASCILIVQVESGTGKGR
jgi:hypothetical protein